MMACVDYVKGDAPIDQPKTISTAPSNGSGHRQLAQMFTDDVAHHRQALAAFRRDAKGVMDTAERAIAVGRLRADLTIRDTIAKADIHGKVDPLNTILMSDYVARMRMARNSIRNPFKRFLN
jgi:hypothetical protein